MFDINDAAQNDIWDDETGETVGQAMTRFGSFGTLISAAEARTILSQEGHPVVMSFGYGEDPVDFDEVTMDDFEGVTDEEADSMWGPFAVWTVDQPKVVVVADLIAAELMTGNPDGDRAQTITQNILLALSRAGVVLMAPQDIEWGQCPGSGSGEPHRVALNMCSGCLEYDPE